MIETSTEQQIHYTTFNELQNPQLSLITFKTIEEGFQSKEWRINFETLTHLRQANRYYANIFLQELLPKTYNHIIHQIDNLRSNNSKEALTLTWEFLEHQNIQKVHEDIICSLLTAIFVKSVNEKAFLRNQALKGINILPKKYNPYLSRQLGAHTQSNNGTIAELAVKTLSQYLDNNKIVDVDTDFLKILAKNIDGKRAFIQRKGRQILINLKKRAGEAKLLEMIKTNGNLNEEETALLLRQLKKESQKGSKKQSNFRDFLKMQKSQSA